MTISVDEAVIARLESHGETFEILVDPKKALKLKRGEEVKDFLAVREVFEDSNKGKRQSREKLNEVFGTNDVEKIAKKIIKKGEVNITGEQRKEILENKRKNIINSIARKAVNPKTGYPHPPKRIERAIEEAGVKVDLNKTVEEQVTSIIDKIRVKIPISIEEAEVEIIVPSRYSAQSFGIIKDFGKIKEKKWGEKGNLMVRLKMPLASREKLYNRLSKLTKGAAKIKVLKEK